MRAGRGNCAEEGLGVGTLPNVLSSATSGESHQLCDHVRHLLKPQPPPPCLLSGKVKPFRVAVEIA